MSAKAVTYYSVECDEPDCPVDTGYQSDYSAWSDHGQALDEWTNNDGILLPDGRTFCHKHAEPFLCDECREVKHECQCEPEGGES